MRWREETVSGDEAGPELERRKVANVENRGGFFANHINPLTTDWNSKWGHFISCSINQKCWKLSNLLGRIDKIRSPVNFPLGELTASRELALKGNRLSQKR